MASRPLQPSARSLISIVAFILVWELLARARFVAGSLFPPPSQVLLALGEMARSHDRPTASELPWLSDLVADVGVSLWRALQGWVFGSVAGVIVGLSTGRIEAAASYIAPIINLFRPLPPVAIIPVIITWFGIGELSKVFSIAFAVFFPVWINAHVGAQSIPQTYLWSARSLRVTRATTVWKVIFPGALPIIVAGLRTGTALAFVMVYVSELAGASSGIGYEISISHLAYRVDRMLAALAVLGALGATADYLLVRALHAFFPWLHHASQK